MPSSAIRSRHSLPLLASIALALAAAPGARAELLNEPPVIRPETLRQVAPGVSIIPDPRINYVPNIGIVEGRDAILVVDTGMGPANGRLVYDKARAIARGRRIYLTTTHFHPEHSFGASAFPASDVIQNRLQAAELAEKGMPYARLFSGFGANERAALEGVEIVKAGISYTGRKTLDLGGRIVILQEMPAHTRGDQIVFVPDGACCSPATWSRTASFRSCPTRTPRAAAGSRCSGSCSISSPASSCPAMARSAMPR